MVNKKTKKNSSSKKPAPKKQIKKVTKPKAKKAAKPKVVKKEKKSVKTQKEEKLSKVDANKLARAKKLAREEKAQSKDVPVGKLSKKAQEIETKVVRLVEKGKDRGFVTYDEILKEFPTVEDDIL